MAVLIAVSGAAVVVTELDLLSILGHASLADENDSMLVGRASVIDGDTIEIQDQRVRFNGIDAPESRQTCTNDSGESYRCGAVAADALDRFLAESRPTSCEYVTRDRYGRMVGVCFRADGANVSRWMVRSGHAMHWPRYSKGVYALDEMYARTRSRHLGGNCPSTMGVAGRKALVDGDYRRIALIRL